MHWIPNSSSRLCRGAILILGITVLWPLALTQQWGGWSRPLPMREVDARTGYAAAVDDDARLHVLSGEMTETGLWLQLWVVDQQGLNPVLWEYGPVVGCITGLSLLWADSQWHLAWGVDQTGFFYAAVSPHGEGARPRQVVPVQRPMGAPFLVWGRGGLHLLWNSMCHGWHQVYRVSASGSGQFTLPPVRLSHDQAPTAVMGAVCDDDVLYISLLILRESWADLTIMAHMKKDVVISERVGITSMHDPGRVHLEKGADHGVIASWSGGEMARSQLRGARPLVGTWDRGDWLVGPLVLGEGAGQVMAVRAAVGADRILISWMETQDGRLVIRAATMTTAGEWRESSRVIWDDREFLDPRPFVLSQGQEILLASLRVSPELDGLFILCRDGSEPPWWYRLGLNPLDPWGDAGFKLFLGMMAGLLSSILALPALLLGLAVVVVTEKLLPSDRPFPRRMRSLLVFLTLWSCRHPQSWLFAQILPVGYPAAYFTAFVSAGLVLNFSRAWGWDDEERVHLMGRGVFFVVVDSWLNLLAGVL